MLQYVKATVVGVERVEYDQRATGRHVSGQRLFFEWDDQSISGQRCGTAFVSLSNGQYSSFSVGDEALVQYDDFKNSCSVIPSTFSANF